MAAGKRGVNGLKSGIGILWDVLVGTVDDIGDGTLT